MTELVFDIPLSLRSTNRWKAMHFHAYRHYRNVICGWVKARTQGKRPVLPYQRVRVTVLIRSIQRMDDDNLVGACKPLLDVLQPLSARHRSGLGIIFNDSPAHMTLVVSWEKAATRAAEGTTIRIEPLEAVG